MHLRSLIIALTFFWGTSANAGVIVGDKEWRQLTETTDLTSPQLDAIYDVATGQLDTATTTIGQTTTVRRPIGMPRNRRPFH